VSNNEIDINTWNISWPQPKDVKTHVASTSITMLEKKYVNEAIDSNWIGPGGRFNLLCEKFLSEKLDQEAILVSNGTIALVLALQGLGIGPGDEVIVPDLTFAATASAVIMVGAQPVFSDVDLNSWCVERHNVEKLVSKKTKAIIAVHLYGNVGGIQELSKFCQERSIFLIEDCAEAFLAKESNGGIAGTFGDIATFSFFANKLITSGEGGAVTSKSRLLMDRMRLLRGQGMDPDKRYFFVIPGSNYRITNIQAAILWGQLERLTEIYESRMNQETRYRMNLGGKILISSNSSSANRAPWLFTCRLPGMDLNRKLKLAHSLAERGIETRPVFYPLTCMPAFKKYSDGVNANTWLISSEGITLPTGSHVNDDTVDLISNLIIKETKD
jgi:perosamine synthetase